jgi:branched-chain amino acid transport system permease protein
MTRRLFASPYAPIGVILLVVLVLPLALPGNFYLRVAALVYINAIAVLGLNLLMGYTGLVSLGHAGFFGLGAYAVTLGPAVLGLPVWLSLLAGAALSALTAFVVGRPILRLRGYYLAVATLGLGLLIWMLFNNQSELTGGPNGMPVPRLVLFGWRASGPWAWYWISGATLVLGAFITANLINSPTGRAFRAIHDSEIASRVLGIDIARYKSLVFVLSAAYAAIAGSYFALFDGFVTPDTASFIRSIEFVVMAVLGGLGSIFGSIVGSAFLVILPQALTVFHDYEEIVLGLIMIVFVIVLPRGVVPSLLARLRWGST